MNLRIQFEYCVPDSQKLADLYGAQHDLNEAIRYCDLHIEIDPTEGDISFEEVMRREHTRNALCRAALISYGRCFGSGVRVGLGQDLIHQLPDELRDRHAQVKNLRDKWVAHSVNHFDDIRIRIDAIIDPVGEFEFCGISMASQMVGTFLRDWMIAYRVLFMAVFALVNEKISLETSILSEKVKGMHPQELMRLERVDGIPLARKSWNPGENRGRFKSN